MKKFDPAARAELVAHLKDLGGVRSEGPKPVVSLERFFQGNNDDASLGENLAEHPGIDAFQALLTEIRSEPDVGDLVVEVRGFDEDSWPFAKGVYVVTGADGEKVASWFAPLRPTSITSGFRVAPPPGMAPGFTSPDGPQVFGVWWD